MYRHREKATELTYALDGSLIKIYEKTLLIEPWQAPW